MSLYSIFVARRSQTFIARWRYHQAAAPKQFHLHSLQKKWLSAFNINQSYTKFLHIYNFCQFLSKKSRKNLIRTRRIPQCHRAEIQFLPR